MFKAEALPGVGYHGNMVELFESLARKYDKQLYNLALRMTGNPEEASDIAQEALVRAFKSFKKWRGESSFGQWLFRIATNIYIDEVRRRKRIRFESLDTPIETKEGQIERHIVDTSGNPDMLIERIEFNDKIREAMESLPPEYRMAVILCDIQGFSYAEISQILDCSIGTVRSRIHRGRRLLRGRLSGYIEDYQAHER